MSQAGGAGQGRMSRPPSHEPMFWRAGSSCLWLENGPTEGTLASAGCAPLKASMEGSQECWPRGGIERLTMSNDGNFSPQDDDPAWTRARSRARSQREFYGHLTIYCLVSSLLLILDYANGTSGSTFLGLDWAFWPIGGWGIGIVLHALQAFGPGGNWETQRAAQLYDKEQRRRQSHQNQTRQQQD